MQGMTISQLLQLTKTEILAIRDHIDRALPTLSIGSDERGAVEVTLRNIDQVLARPEFHFYGEKWIVDPN